MIKLIQQNKGLYDAAFIIIENGQQVGNIIVSGNVAMKLEANIQINYKYTSLSLSRTDGKTAKQMTGLSMNPFSGYTRPFVLGNSNCSGVVFNDTKKGRKVLRFATEEYDMYPIGFGKKGICCPVYKRGECIGEVQKAPEVINDLHTYDIYPKYENDIVPFLIETIYYYITAHYKAGQQTISGKTVHTHTTTDKNRIRLCQNPYYLNQ